MSVSDINPAKVDGFVRKTVIEASPAPNLGKGPVAWVVTNLLSSVPNVLMTVAAILFIAWVVPPLVNFVFVNAIFVGADRDACLVDKVGGPVGACWAFVSARLGYFMYGQYPFDERWRVNLTWALGALGILWLLWPRIGAKVIGGIYFFVLFPIAAFVLLSGGVFGLVEVPTNLWGGLLVTLVISSVGIVVSLPFGIVLALGRRSNMPIAKYFAITFIEFVRGVPLITVLFMANVMLPLFLPQGWRPDSLLRVLIGVALFASAYMAEVVRGGLQAMPKGQYEGAMALGLNYPQMMLFVILPQALKLVIPGIVNTFIGLFKDTSLVAIVGIFDLMKAIEASNSDSKWATPVTSYTGYLFAAIIYFIFCFGMSRYSLFVERRLDTGHKR